MNSEVGTSNSRYLILYFLGYHCKQAELFEHHSYFAGCALKWLDIKYQPNYHYSHNHRLGNRNMFYEWPVVEIYLKMLPVYHIFHISQDIHQNVQMRLLPFPKKRQEKNVLKIELYTQIYTQSKEGLSSILLL